MAKSSRWSQWVIAESADPRIQMPWAIASHQGQVRRASFGEVPGVIASGDFVPQQLHLR
ncbi:MAG: hypothetical protein KJZ59_10080 [Pararhodobacter sp.]|nr:hypothetical protein [Pararhodobacter sp.]